MAGRSAPPPRHSIVAYARWADYQAEWRLAHAWSVENRATSRLWSSRTFPKVFCVVSALERAGFKRSFNGIHETGSGIQETGKWYTGGMLRTITRFLSLTLVSSAAFAADTPTVGQTLDGQFRNAEREIIGLVEAMPADKINFTPSGLDIKGAEFETVRTFGQQAKHLATYIYIVSSAVLEQKPPIDIGQGDGGPDSVGTKEQIVEYMRGAFAFGHKALQSITEKNEMDPVGLMPGSQMARIAAGVFMMYHNFDHYGQMVVYARINGVVPPASRPR